MRRLSERAEAQIVVKKSRFIAIALPISSLDEVKGVVKAIWQEHPDATHVVHAAVVGRTGTLYSCSDDREPKNTAGRPALEVLKGSGLTDIIVCVVRYFGGTLLGTGGLVKAYQDSVKEALATLPVCERVIPAFLKLSFDHRHVTVFMRLLNELKGEVVNSAFDEKAHYEVMLPEGAVTAFTGRFTETVRGQLTLERVRK